CPVRVIYLPPRAPAAAYTVSLHDALPIYIRRMPWPRWKVCRKAWPEILAGWIPVGGQTLLRTELVREVGGWKEGMIVAEDQDLRSEEHTSELQSRVEVVCRLLLENKKR